MFFDTVGITWAYEAQGYETSAGPYLPDFELSLEPRWWSERLWPADRDEATGCICDTERISGHCPFHNPEPSPCRVFLEVKGDGDRWKSPDPRWLEMARHREFYVAYGLPRIEVLAARTDAREFRTSETEAESLAAIQADGQVWVNQFFRDCPFCRGIGIDQFGALLMSAPPWSGDDGCLGATRCCGVVWKEPHTAPSRAASPRMVAGYAAARAARFEHGESGR